MSFNDDFLLEQNAITPAEAFRPPPTIVTDIKAIVNTLNRDQIIVFNKVVEAIRNPSGTPIRMFLSGEGGVGKSYLIRLLTQYIQGFYSHDALLLCAPSGVAAFNIGGSTCHWAFGLPVDHGSVPAYNRLGAQSLARYRQTYKNLKFVILDECSMLNYETLRMISLRLGEIFNNDEPFGGVHVILGGDLLQLAPPMGHWIFDQPAKCRGEVDLWRLFQMSELTNNVRQSQDPLGGICSRFRVGELTQEDITTLNSRLLDPKNPNIDTTRFENCTWVFNTKKKVKLYNQRKTIELRQRLASIGQRMSVINSRDYIAGARNKCSKNLLDPDDSKTGGLVSSLTLAEGAESCSATILTLV